MNKQEKTISPRTMHRLAVLLPWLPALIPLMLLPLLIGWVWQTLAPAEFNYWREDLMFAYLLYIAIVRFALLDVMLFYVAHQRRPMHLDLLHLVFLYLEVTAFTLLFFALMYQQFGVFDLFTYNAQGTLAHSEALQAHPFRVSLYISVAFFVTLGIGDWVPQTLNAMMAAGIEAILGFVQSGVFFAVLIYAHQDGNQKGG